MARSTCGTALLVLATILGPIVLVLLAISFGTSHWLEFSVNRSGITNVTFKDESSKIVRKARYSYTRNRGFFRECYPGTDTFFLENIAENEEQPLDNYCFRVRYEVPYPESFGRDFLSRIHLIRCWLAFFVIALVVFLIAYMFGLVLCCWRKSKWAYIAGLCAYVAAFSTATSIAFFHGSEYLERNKITEEDPYMGKFYFTFSSDLKQATTRDYGYSYIIGWISMIIAAFTATLYSTAGCYIGRERPHNEKYQEKGRSKDYLEMSYPMPLEPPYKEYYGYPGYGYQGQFVYDMDGRLSYPVVELGPEPMPAHYNWH